MSDGNAEAVELDVARARAGDRSALESVARARLDLTRIK